MILRNNPLSACVGKSAFSCYRHAAEGLKRTKERRSRLTPKHLGQKKIKPYRCEYCGFWHVGHDAINVALIKKSITLDESEDL